LHGAVADHRLGGHVADQSPREAAALAHQLSDVRHAVALDGVGPRLIEHDDQHP
jgi:hypothetical protein